MKQQIQRMRNSTQQQSPSPSLNRASRRAQRREDYMPFTLNRPDPFAQIQVMKKLGIKSTPKPTARPKTQRDYSHIIIKELANRLSESGYENL